MITADNITDEQIRELRELGAYEGDDVTDAELRDLCVLAEAVDPNWPGGARYWARQHHAARIRCAEILNARDKDVTMLTGATITDDMIRELCESASDHSVTVICKEALGILPCNACKTRQRRGLDGNCPSCANERSIARARCAAMINERAKEST